MSFTNEAISETELIERCKRNDREAVRLLLVIHGDLIAQVAARMSYNKQLREDIFQEVVKQVILRICSFKGKSRFSTWLYRVAVNTALKLLKKEKQCCAETMPDEIAGDNDNIYAGYEQNEIRKHVLNTVASLASRQKECVSLYYFAEMSVAQIAETLNVNENAVKTALFKARKNITNHLHKKGIIECV